jgi:hypothetical protein
MRGRIIFGVARFLLKFYSPSTDIAFGMGVGEI